jgi:uncharacterized membrane protein (DUF485 family)
MNDFKDTRIFNVYHWLMRRMEVKTLTFLLTIAFLMIYFVYAIFGMTEHDAGMMYAGLACAMITHAFIGVPVHIWYGVQLRRHYKQYVLRAGFDSEGIDFYESRIMKSAKLDTVMYGYTHFDVIIYTVAGLTTSELTFTFGHNVFGWILVGIAFLNICLLCGGHYVTNVKQ